MTTERKRTLAARLLDQAAGIVDGDRRQTHGTPERSFTVIADFWATYLRHRDARFVNGARHPVDAVDVANCMALLKLARSLCGEPVPDHFVDGAAYLALAGEVKLLDERERTETASAAPAQCAPAPVPANDMEVEVALAGIRDEFYRAVLKHPPMRSLLEGLAIVEEESDELKQEIRRREPDRTAVRTEANQLGAMVLRLIVDLLLEGTDTAPAVRTSWAIGAEINALATKIQELEAEHAQAARAERAAA